MISAEGAALLCLIGALAGFGAGVTVAAIYKNGQIARQEAVQAGQVAQLERVARVRQHLAQVRGDELTTALHVASTAALRLQEQLDDEIARNTSGRACLDAGALRVLDRAVTAARGLPAPTGRAAAADARQPAADPAQPAASDADVARWANAAYGQYAECARRLDALIQWHQPETGASSR